jgi:acyl-CoA hydrolase/GNAT superfamily N-acetyltransferase
MLEDPISQDYLERLKQRHPDKFASEGFFFRNIHRGDRIFVSTGCGEPQYLVGALIDYVTANPKALVDTEVLHIWTLGVAPYANEKFKDNFRQNSFFIGDSTRGAVNSGLADYTPIFLSAVPGLFKRRLVGIDVALIQTSMPDVHGYMSLGVSVDISKAATDAAKLVIAQVNPNMPRVHGNTFIHVDDIDFIVVHEEPLLVYEPVVSDDVADRVGKYVARIVEDGDTLQVGYGSLPNAILNNLTGKKHLGIHTELLTDGIVKLMQLGVVDNTMKTIDRGKTVATFCMGTPHTYEYIHDNPSVEFKPIDYTNNPMIIARNDNMVAINAALQIDLTGQATAESLGKTFYSGVGGQADFMRGAMHANGGKTILAVQSTAESGRFSRIVPCLLEGAGVTLVRGDMHYVITEYGIAYLHGKNVRERAMDLIAIAHPKFRLWLVAEAKKLGLIYQDQAFIPGKKGEYPEEMETWRTMSTGELYLLRPVKISDEPLLKDFFYSLSDQSIYRRFISMRTDMPHERLQEFVIIDYTKETIILAVKLTEHGEKEEIISLAQYGIDEATHSAEVAFVVRDDYQGKGIGTETLNYLTLLAIKRGLLGFTATVLIENKAMLHVFEKMGFAIDIRPSDGVFDLKMTFKASAEYPRTARRAITLAPPIK